MPSRSLPEVLVVVRALNEAPTLAKVLDNLASASYPVLVVDDGSRDETFAIARDKARWVIRHETNLGPGAALETGLRAAVREAPRFIATFDADDQHQVSDLARCLEPLRNGEADLVIGSRFLRPEDRARVPRGRRVLLRVGSLVNLLLTRLWLSDPHNGIRALTRNAARRLHLRETGFAYATELVAEARRLELRVVEVPVTIHYTRRSLAKGQTSWNAVNIVLDFLSHRVFK